MLLAFFSPFALLLMLLAITLAAWLHQDVRRRKRRSAVAQLARDWRMHYSPYDVFNLAPRVAAHLPFPGAATIRVRDLIYGNVDGGHRYIFCAEYSLGVVRARKRRQCVVSVFEPRGEGAAWESLQVADAGEQFIEQYEMLWGTLNESQLVSRG